MGGISGGYFALWHACVLFVLATCSEHVGDWPVMIFSALTINIPFGTALSVYAFLVLSRESVKERFRCG